MWKSKDSGPLKLQLQQHFQNMTKAMDCVGCEKCKLWGKLQLLGELFSAIHFFSTAAVCRSGSGFPVLAGTMFLPVISLIHKLGWNQSAACMSPYVCLMMPLGSSRQQS